MLSAERARQIADQARDIDGPYMRKELEHVAEHIKAAADKGDYAITVYSRLNSINVTRLEKLGFSVEVCIAAHQRDESYVHISWEAKAAIKAPPKKI